MPDGFCRAEEPRRFAVTAVVTARPARHSRMSGMLRYDPLSAAQRERVMGVAFGQVRLPLRDRDTGTRGQRRRQVPASFAETASSAQRRAATRSPRASATSAMGLTFTAAISFWPLNRCQAASLASVTAATSPAARAATANTA